MEKDNVPIATKMMWLDHAAIAAMQAIIINEKKAGYGAMQLSDSELSYIAAGAYKIAHAMLEGHYSMETRLIYDEEYLQRQNQLI